MCLFSVPMLSTGQTEWQNEVCIFCSNPANRTVMLCVFSVPALSTGPWCCVYFLFQSCQQDRDAVCIFCSSPVNRTVKLCVFPVPVLSTGPWRCVYFLFQSCQQDRDAAFDRLPLLCCWWHTSLYAIGRNITANKQTKPITENNKTNNNKKDLTETSMMRIVTAVKKDLK